jgi:hypothetical protein
MHESDDVEMSPQRAQEVRRAVIAAAQQEPPPVVVWPWKLAIAAASLLVLAGGAGDVGPLGSNESGVTAPAPGGERRQLQFATPGGTRIIWELNPEFTLRETLP